MMMKKIINGKMYNTDTAEHVGSYSSSYFPGDAKYYEEDLYLKKTGEFFLCGKGGALTKYAETFGNARGGGSAIVPLSRSEAKEWVEEFEDVDTYIELFGEVEE